LVIFILSNFTILTISYKKSLMSDKNKKEHFKKS